MSEQSKEELTWIRRLETFCKALDSLKVDVELAAERDLSDREKRAVVKDFEITQEWAWRATKEFFRYEGEPEGSIDDDFAVFRLAFRRGLIPCGNLVETGKLIREHRRDERAFENFHHVCHKAINTYYREFETLRDALLRQKEKWGL